MPSCFSLVVRCLKAKAVRVAHAGFVSGIAGLLFVPSALACHSSFPDWRKLADPAGYLFCSTVFQHLDASGLREEPQVSEAERQHGHACHLDCRPPGEGFLMGHVHGIMLPDGKCNIEVVQACQLNALPETGKRAVPGVQLKNRPHLPDEVFRPLPGK